MSREWKAGPSQRAVGSAFPMLEPRNRISLFNGVSTFITGWKLSQKDGFPSYRVHWVYLRHVRSGISLVSEPTF